MTIQDVLSRLGWMWTAAAVIGLLLLFWSLPMGSLTIGIGTGGLMTVIFLREVL